MATLTPTVAVKESHSCAKANKAPAKPTAATIPEGVLLKDLRILHATTAMAPATTAPKEILL